MPRLNDALSEALIACGDKPGDHAPQSEKKNYNERVSSVIALTLAHELRSRGMSGARPDPSLSGSARGAERRLAGGIGAKRVDVTWSTEESGLILALSVKTILFRDATSKNFQKNLTNRRADLLNEAVTLHRRFPYAVLGALLFLDAGAVADGTARRASTFVNAGPRLRLFTGRRDPAGRDEQYEKFYVLLLNLDGAVPAIEAFEANDLTRSVDLDDALDDMMTLIGERNFDLYDAAGGLIRRV